MSAADERLLRPRRAGLAAVTRALRGDELPAEAWESFATAGIIPDDWLQHPARRYQWEAPTGGRIAYFPPTVEFATLLAADIRDAQTAEAVAREAYPDLAATGSIVWRLVPENLLGGTRSMLSAGFRSGSMRAIDALVDTGFYVDPMATQALVFLMAR